MKYTLHLIAFALIYLLGIKDGHIALWKDGNPEPVEIFPFRADMLPTADQELLRRGIQIDSSADLAELLQDYLS